MLCLIPALLMAHFLRSTELNKKIEKCDTEREMLDKKLGKLYFAGLVILVYLLLAVKLMTGDQDTVERRLTVSAYPQTQHGQVARYWAVIMFACFTVALRVCNSGDCPCSYIDLDFFLLVHKCSQ